MQFMEIIEKVRAVMGQDCKVDYFIVEEIENEDSGKYRYTKSKVKDR